MKKPKNGGQSREMVAARALETFVVMQRDEAAERLELADWQGAFSAHPSRILDQ